MATSGHLWDLNFAYIVRMASSGYNVGQLDPDSPGAGPTVSPAFLIKGPTKLTTAKATRATVEWRGGGVPEGKKQAGVDTINAATLEVTRWDNTLDTLISGGSIDTTSLTNAEISAPNNMNPTPNVLAFVGISKIDIPGSSTVKYIHFVYPNVTISKTTPDMQQVEGNQKNPNNVTLTIEPSIASKFIVGKAFSSNQGWYGNTEFEHSLIYTAPYMMDAWVADGIATTFTLTAIPSSSLVTSGHTTNWVTKNGTETAPTSISTSTGAVVISAAGSAADIWNVWYPTTPARLAALAA